MRIRISLIWLVLLCASAVSGQSDWKSFTSIINISEIEFYNNKLYATNAGGLLEIDLDTGEEFLYTKENSGLFSSGTDQLDIVDNGDIWISSKDSGLQQFNGESITNGASPILEFGIKDIKDIKATEETVWFNTGFLNSTSFYSITNEILTVLPGHAEAFCLDNDDNLLVASNNKIYQYNGIEAIFKLDIPDSTGSFNYVLSHLYVDSSNTIWAVSGGGDNYSVSGSQYVHAYRDEKWTSYELPVALYVALSMHETELGEIIIGSYDLVATIKDTLRIDTISQVFKDIPYDETRRYDYMKVVAVEDDSYWVTYFTGLDKPQLYRIKNGETTTYAQNKSYFHYGYGSIETDCNGLLHSMSPDRTLQTFENNEWTKDTIGSFDFDCINIRLALNPYTCEMWAYSNSSRNCLSLWNFTSDEIIETDILPDDLTQSISFDEDGNIYVVSNSKLYQITTTGSSICYTGPNAPIITNYVHYATDGTLWAIGENLNSNDAIHWLKNGEWNTRDDYNAPFRILTNPLFEDNQGHIWISGRFQFLEYDQLNWVIHPTPFLSSSSVITRMVQDKNGNYWIGTSRDGLIKWDKTNSEAYTLNNSEMLSNDVIDLKISNDSLLWIKTPKGISKMKIDLSTNTKEVNLNLVKFSLYPNPTHGSFTLSFPHIEKRKVELFSINGRLIYSTDTADKSLTISSLISNDIEAGAYWVRVSGSSGRAIEKFVVY